MDIGRRTDDGLPIYDAAELKIGLGGGVYAFVSLSEELTEVISLQVCRYSAVSNYIKADCSFQIRMTAHLIVIVSLAVLACHAWFGRF